jgi:hypothetical protein
MRSIFLYIIEMVNLKPLVIYFFQREYQDKSYIQLRVDLRAV